MKRALGRLVPVPIRVGTLDDDFSFVVESFDDHLDIKLAVFCVSDAESDVFEVTEDGDAWCAMVVGIHRLPISNKAR